MKFKPLSRQVILITGASSGIGLLTAKAAAELGAKVILIARNESALRDAVNEIAQKGGQATFAVADVGDLDAFRAAAEQGLAHFGQGVDTWVNNAGTGLWGKTTETDLADDRKLFDTNFWGVVHGSRLAVEHLRGDGGKLINVGSVVSDASIPPQAMYAASKHAVAGFTDGLRIEIKNEQLPISVTLIKPAAIDTPFARHARNYTGKEASLPSPIYDPELVASAILYAATHEKRDLYVGTGGKIMGLTQTRFPSFMDLIFSTNRMMWGEQLQDRPLERPEGALHAPDDRDAVGHERGGLSEQKHVNRVSVYNSAVQHPIATGALLTTLAGAAAAALIVGANRRPQTWRDRLLDAASDYASRARDRALETASRAKSSAERVFG